MTPGTLLLGRYRVIEELGSGGYGVVLGVRDESLQRDVAMKLLHRTRTQSTHDVSRFFREAEACARLTSPHVARLYHADESPELGPFMVMEWLRGSDLGLVLRREGPLPIPAAITHVLEAASALAEAHALGIVHRDLKPTNLFRAIEGPRAVTKVLDFGMAKTVDDAAQLTATGALVGTPRYMAPEQLTAPRDADHRVDIWALAVVLYELVSGASPYFIDDARGIAGFLFRPPSIPLRQVLPSAPPALEQLLLRCLSAQPAERPAHMGELAIALGPFAAGDAAARVQNVLAYRPPLLRAGAAPVLPMPEAPARSATPPPPREPASRSGASVLVLLISLAALVASGALFLASRRNEQPSTPTATDGAAGDAAPIFVAETTAALGTSSSAPAPSSAMPSTPSATARPMPTPGPTSPALPSAAPTVPPSATVPPSQKNVPFDGAAAGRAMNSVDVKACKKLGGTQPGSAHVTISFRADGTPASIVVDPPFAGTAMGTCLIERFRSVRVPPFTGADVRVGRGVSYPN